MIGQTFTSARYFHPRPTALAVNGKEFYDASTSGGSNWGPNSKALAALVAARLEAVEKTYGVTARQVPADMVTASFSGLDPDISVQNARIQAPVVARARGIAVSKVLDLISKHTDDPTLGFLGGTRVNVLDLNLALDRSAST
jgi:K+-transporting ATPase ATPase C chain